MGEVFSQVLKKRAQAIYHRIKVARHQMLDGFIYVHITKTGGTSIREAFNLPHEHKPAYRIIEDIGRKRWDHKYTFSVVRNPWDKVVSTFTFRKRIGHGILKEKEISFQEWVRLTFGEMRPEYYDSEWMFMPQTNWLTDSDGIIAVDYICRFENLQDDFRKVCDHLGKKVFLPHLNKSRRESYRGYYDDASKKLVDDWFVKDIENFNYRF